jgi:hypothetical protein
MNWIVVLVTLSAAHPCPPASAPTPGCVDQVERMDTTSLAQCEVYAAWWRQHIRELEAGTEDRGNAICVEAPK